MDLPKTKIIFYDYCYGDGVAEVGSNTVRLPRIGENIYYDGRYGIVKKIIHHIEVNEIRVYVSFD